jgi:hypothetical protein
MIKGVNERNKNIAPTHLLGHVLQITKETLLVDEKQESINRL